MKKVILSIFILMFVNGTLAAQTPEDLTQRAIDSGDEKKSFGFIDKALEIDSEYVPAYIVKAGIYAEMGNYDAALQACDRAIKIAPNYREAYRVRALLKEKIGDIEGAKKDRQIQKTLIQEGKSYWLEKANKELARAEEALQTQQKSQSRQVIDKKMEIGSDYAEALLQRAQAKLRNGDCQGAIEDYNRYQQTVELNSRAFTGKASAQRKLNDLEGAINTYTELITHYPEITTFYENRAVLYEKVGESEKAELDRSAIEYLHWKNKKVSEESWSKRIDNNPDKGSLYLDRAYYRIQLGNYEGALEDYKKALELTDPGDRRARYYRKMEIDKTQKMIKERDDQKVLEKQAVLDKGEAVVKGFKKKNVELLMQVGKPES